MQSVNTALKAPMFDKVTFALLFLFLFALVLSVEITEGSIA